MFIIIGACPLNTLHAVSALGTSLSFYTLDTTNADAEIVPAAIPRHPSKVNDTAPAARWAYDILEPAGEEQFRNVVEEIWAECANL